MFAVLPEPRRKGRLTRHASVYEAGGSDRTQDGMRRHQAPLLLGTVDHTVYQVSIADTLCGLVKHFQGLELLFTACVAGGELRARLQVVFLNHEIAELVVVEVQLDLVIEGLVAGGSKHAGAEQLVSDIPRFQDDVLLPGFGHSLALIEAQGFLVELGL